MDTNRTLVVMILLITPVIAFFMLYGSLPEGTSFLTVARYFTYAFTCRNVWILLTELTCLLTGFYFFHVVLKGDGGGTHMFFGTVFWALSMFMPLILGYSGKIQSCW